ncbi:MAG: hypothetical protein QG656_2786 [Candidatus Hydrogenedentes bacterium]|nr:hypothetical protein [Candidatus Hydrogenedentota bacterium]
MTQTNHRPPAPLVLKPNLEDTARRWEAYWAGDLIDRPMVWVTAPVPGFEYRPIDGYRERVYGDLDELVAKALHNAAGTIYGGESVPQFYASFGCDEITAFCGGSLCWSHESAGDTNWSVPFVRDWANVLPLRIRDDHPLWLRMQEQYRKAERAMAGRVLIMPIDLHTNMDILMAARGSEDLCRDLLEQPETIDRAMRDARAVFPVVWNTLRDLAKMDEHGYAAGAYSMTGCATLQCDFSCMMSPAQFRRWVMPALEEEAAIVRHALYHWDGPRALIHADDLLATKGLHTFAFVPDPGIRHIQHLDLFKRVQAAGKAVAVYGTVDEIKTMHRELKPNQVIYYTSVCTESEIETLLDWFVRNT